MFRRAALGVLAAWGTLVAGYLLERVVLFPIARLLGAEWGPSVLLLADVGVLCAAGYVASRVASMRVAWAVAATMGLHSLAPVSSLDIPWALKSLVNAAGDVRYLPSAFQTLIVQGFLLGAFIVGARIGAPTTDTSLRLKQAGMEANDMMEVT